jgi:hypothetical protein
MPSVNESPTHTSRSATLGLSRPGGPGPRPGRSPGSGRTCYRAGDSPKCLRIRTTGHPDDRPGPPLLQSRRGGPAVLARAGAPGAPGRATPDGGDRSAGETRGYTGRDDGDRGGRDRDGADGRVRPAGQFRGGSGGRTRSRTRPSGGATGVRGRRQHLGRGPVTPHARRPQRDRGDVLPGVRLLRRGRRLPADPGARHSVRGQRAEWHLGGT